MASFQIPNLPTLCGPSFTLRANKHCRVAGETALAWTKEHGFLDAEELVALPGAQVPLLASLCYATCDIAQLVLLVEFMTLLTHWWDRGWDERSEEAWNDVFKRVRRTTSEDWQTRFQETLQAFRVAKTDEGSRQAALVDVDAYVAWRKQSSGVTLGIALIEYAEGLNIPETTRSAESFQQLRDCTIEIVIWMHDIASYNIQQAAEDRHNVVAIMMSEKKVPLQTAVNAAGERLKSLVEKFLAAEKVVMGSADREVRAYVAGLRDWIIGTAHWVYRTDRYFRGKGDNVKTFGWVFLLPKVGEA